MLKCWLVRALTPFSSIHPRLPGVGRMLFASDFATATSRAEFSGRSRKGVKNFRGFRLHCP